VTGFYVLLNKEADRTILLSPLTMKLESCQFMNGNYSCSIHCMIK